MSANTQKKSKTLYAPNFRSFNGARMHYYPRVTSSSSLSLCGRAACLSFSSLCSRVTCNGRHACDCFTCRASAAQAQRLARVISPLFQHTSCDLQTNANHTCTANGLLIGANAITIVEALLRHVCPSPGALVLVPGLLLSPHTALLAVLDTWHLRVVGYDMDFVSMQIDVSSVQRGARGIVSLFVLAGIGTRFPRNAQEAIAAARPSYSLSLEPFSALSGVNREHAVDLRVFSINATGIDTGAVAQTANALLARHMQSTLRRFSRESPRATAAAVTRHVAMRVLSDGVSFRFAVAAAQVAGAAHDTNSAAQRLVTFLRTSRAVLAQPAPARIAAMTDTVRRVKCTEGNVCVAQWDFASRAKCDVEFVSLGEPWAPWGSGESAGLLLRVESPEMAAAAAQSVGFDAFALRPVTHTPPPTHNEKEKPKGKDLVGESVGFAVNDAVVMPDCPKCVALAAHAVFVPLRAAMKSQNRERLRRLMCSPNGARLFRSPCDAFHTFAAGTPRAHAYRSTEVDAMLAASAQRGDRSAFTDPMPLLVSCIFGPVPGYILSKM